MPEKRDVAVLSITGIDVVLPVVPSFAHHVVGTHSRQGNTGRPRSEAALLESKLDDSWIANPEAFSCCCMLRPHSPALGPGPGFWQIRLGTPGALLRRQHIAWGEKKKKRRGEKEEIEIAGRRGRALGVGLTKRPYCGEKGLFSQAFLRQLFSAPKQRQRGLSGGPRARSRARTNEQDQIL